MVQARGIATVTAVAACAIVFASCAGSAVGMINGLNFLNGQWSPDKYAGLECEWPLAQGAFVPVALVGGLSFGMSLLPGSAGLLACSRLFPLNSLGGARLKGRLVSQ